MSWKYYGEEDYEKRINRVFELTEYAEQFVKGSDQLELMAERQSVSLCFRYKVPEDVEANEFNKLLREELRESGKTLVNYGFIGNDLSLRLVIINPELTETDIDKFFGFVNSEAQKLLLKL